AMNDHAVNDPLPGAVLPPQPSDEAFNPLLRSLLSWGLVTRAEAADGSASWELTEGAQRRLDELVPHRPRAVTTLAYLDHLCADCRGQKLTYLREGRYLCEACGGSEASLRPMPSSSS
ncbi:MAG: hypothetical protein ACRD0B_05900, partial [Acidimicrobiales bacterium]